jgi:putative transposase
MFNVTSLKRKNHFRLLSIFQTAEEYRYGISRKAIYTDGARWYNDACKWLRLKHYVYDDDNGLKNLMERFVQQIKDRTECFDDHFPRRKQNCNRQHVWNWLKLFILYLYIWVQTEYNSLHS